jgi:hypothetical protein
MNRSRTCYYLNVNPIVHHRCLPHPHLYPVDLSNQLDGGKWTELLSEKWFGSSDPYTGRIVDGRWESSPVPTLNDAFFEAHGIDKDETFFPEEQTPW